MPTPNNGTAVSISNTPQAKDDAASAGEDRVLTINVLANDLGGNAKSLYSLNQTNPLAVQTTALSHLGAVITMVNGQVTYDSTGASALQALSQGETATDAFTYVIQLGNGALSVATVTVTVTGANDAPTLSADVTASHPITELAATTGAATADTASATLAFHDVDLNDTHTVVLGAPAYSWTLAGGAASDLTVLPATTLSGLQNALQGALSSTLTDSTHTGAGSIALAFSAADKVFDFLANGEVLSVTYDVTAKDNNGLTSTKPVTFTVTGTNDAPVVAAEASPDHMIVETAGVTGSAAAHSLAATLNFTDADLTDSHTVSIAAPTALWSAGATPAATIAALQTALSQTLSDSTHTGAGSVALGFSAADGVFDFLASGETLTVTYNVTVTDSQGATSTQPVTITVTGSNDAPQLSMDSVSNHLLTEISGGTGSSAPDGFTTQLAFTDVDLNDTHTVTIGAAQASWSDGAVPAATLTTLDAALTSALTDSTHSGAGSLALSFSAPDAAFDFLAAGETLKVTYNVTVDDGHGGTSSQPVTITVTGTNDVPTISIGGSAIGAVTEDASASHVEAVTGSIAFADPDLSDHHIVSAAFTSTTGDHGQLGSLTSTVAADSAGTGAGVVNWSYSANDAKLQYLAAGQTVVETYTVTINDQHGGLVTKDISVTITGSNDSPVVQAQSANGPELIHNGGFESGGAFWSNTSPAGIETNPAWVYGVGPDTSRVMEIDVNGGSHDDISQTVATAAGTTYTFSFDTALRSGFPPQSDTFQVVWNGQVIDTVTAGSTTFEHHSYTVVSAGGTGTVEFVETGTDDGVGGIIDNVSLKASGAFLNEIAGQTGQATLDTASVNLLFSDADLADHHTVSASAPTIALSGGGVVPAGLSTILAGALTTSLAEVNAAGSITATFSAPDQAFDFLAQGQTLTVTYNVTADDGHGGTSTQPATFTVTGTNDAASLSGTASGTVHEDGVLNVSGVVNVADPDSGQAHFLAPTAAALHGTYGDFTFNDGAWTYALNNGAANVQALANNQVVHDTLTVTSQDGTATQLIDVAIVGEEHLAQLLANNSFEGGSISSTQIPGWTNQGGTFLEVVGNTFLGIGGDGHLLDTQGTPGGITIAQSVDVITGDHATLSFSVAAELLSDGRHPGSTLSFTWDGVVVKSVTEADFIDANGNMQWNTLKTFTVDVVGQAGADTLSIHDSGTGNVGFALDGVRVDGWVT